MKSQTGATATLTYKVVDKDGNIIGEGSTTETVKLEQPKQPKKED